MANKLQSVPRAESLKRLPEVFKKACKLVEKGSNIKAALKASGMEDRLFYKIASEEMKKELKALSMANTLSLRTRNSISKEHLLYEEDERCED